MYVVINIAGDQTSWWTEKESGASEVVAELASGPADVEVFYPVKGNLLISGRASVAVLDVPPAVSWIPSGVQAPVATLYVQAGPTADFSGYTLAAGEDLADLRNQITTAMGDRPSTIKIPVSSARGSGFALLNGASVTFAVVCPPRIA